MNRRALLAAAAAVVVAPDATAEPAPESAGQEGRWSKPSWIRRGEQYGDVMAGLDRWQAVGIPDHRIGGKDNAGAVNITNLYTRIEWKLVSSTPRPGEGFGAGLLFQTFDGKMYLSVSTRRADRVYFFLYGDDRQWHEV